MKATLTFTEQDELMTALNGAVASGALTDYDNYLRARIKYEDLPEDVQIALEAARHELHVACDGVWNSGLRAAHKPASLWKHIHRWLRNSRKIRVMTYEESIA